MALEDLLDLLGERQPDGSIGPSRSLAQLQEDIDPETGAYNSPFLDTISGARIGPAMAGDPGTLYGPHIPPEVLMGRQLGNPGIPPGIGTGTLPEVTREDITPPPPVFPSPTKEPPMAATGQSTPPPLGTFKRGAPKPVPPPPEVSDGSELIGDPSDNREFSEVLSTLLRRKLGAPASFGDSGDLEEAGAGGFNETIPQGLIRALADKIRPGLNSLVGQEGSPNRNVPVVPPAVPNAPVTPPGPSGDFNQAMLEDMYDIGPQQPPIIPEPEPIRPVDQNKALDVSTGGPDPQGLFLGDEDDPIDNLINKLGLLNVPEDNGSISLLPADEEVDRDKVLQNMPDEIRNLVLARIDEMSNPNRVPLLSDPESQKGGDSMKQKISKYVNIWLKTGSSSEAAKAVGLSEEDASRLLSEKVAGINPELDEIRMGHRDMEGLRGLRPDEW